MPVWHEVTREARERGDVLVVGITQEQHPDRCLLFAQWKEFDWPILWDPLNLTDVGVVPLTAAVDAAGVVRKLRLDPRQWDAELDALLAYDGEPRPAPDPAVREERAGADTDGDAAGAWSKLLWGNSADLDPAIEALQAHLDGLAEDDAERGTATFRLGVARRLRYDSSRSRPQDFQASLDLWRRALFLDPNQYIWRRRIQQYGPRLDKPYPFYDWIDTARGEIAARGEEPVHVEVPLTGSEVAAPTQTLGGREAEDPAPDPQRKVLRDTELVSIETAVALHTQAAGGRVRTRPTARVHLALRPDAERDVHWTNDAGPAVVWVAVPQGWGVARNLFRLEVPARETSSEVRRLDFEVVPPEGAQSASLRAYALYYVCEGKSGECVYRRQDFQVEVKLPPSRGPR